MVRTIISREWRHCGKWVMSVVEEKRKGCSTLASVVVDALRECDKRFGERNRNV